MSEQKVPSKDIRAVAGISLIINMEDRLKEMETELSNLGLGYVEGKMRRDIQQLKSIILTAGDTIANDILVKKINKLEYEATAPRHLRYLPLIRKSLVDTFTAYRFAVSKNFQGYRKQEQHAMSVALSMDSVVHEPQLHFLPKRKKKQKNQVSED